ncbi:AgmX/PglI C-terminal domain-containing protein [bacterium]|nr:AgmX/PglI C-terminal domain-containing protein [bacterium]
MSTLKLVQTTNDGRVKSWKLSEGSDLLTFGCSRKADLNSIDNSLPSFESVIEYRDSQWHYISFTTKNEKADQLIESGTTIKLHASTLKFESFTKDLDILAGLDRINSNGSISKKLVVVSQNNKLLGVHITLPSEKFSLYAEGKQQKVDLPASQDWQQSEMFSYQIRTKIINKEDIAHLKEAAENSGLDKESKKPFIITLSITAAFIFSAIFLAKKEEVLVPVTKTSGSIVVVKNDMKKIKREQNKPSSKAVTSAAPNKAGSQGGSKTTALLKGAIGARISQLLGKVSATEARTANVLVTTQGVKAGEAASGRALAAVGKMEASGRNWNGEAVGNGSGVSTAGVGGGKGTKGLGGGLGQGKTGSGGVGLIEDESEIVGGLDREVIAQYIKTQLGQILYCYERQLSANPNLYGKIAVKFTIAGTGQVETQSINDTTLKNLSVESCILSKVSKWKFPEPKGGTKVLVTYPFLFKSTI